MLETIEKAIHIENELFHKYGEMIEMLKKGRVNSLKKRRALVTLHRELKSGDKKKIAEAVATYRELKRINIIL